MTSSLLHRRPAPIGNPAGTLQRGRVLRDAASIGAFAFLLSVAWSWVPSVWYDEAATVASSTRSWAGLAAEVGSVDSVHAVFYACMHVWFDLVGYSPFSLRLPSAIAVAVAAAGLVALLHTVSTRRIAVIAGLVFSFLPRVVWAGGEGRSFALSTALTVGMLALFVHAFQLGDAPRRTRTLWWAVYSAFAALSVAVVLYLALAVAAAGVTAAVILVRHSRNTAARRGFTGWLCASIGALLITAPLTSRTIGQSGQVSWIDPVGRKTLRDVIEFQFFAGHAKLATLFWLIAIAGVLFAVARVVRVRPGRIGETHAPATGLTPSVLELMLPLLIVPPAALIIGSLITSPLYSPRYATFTAPAFAVLVAIALAALRPRSVRIAAVAALFLLCLIPNLEYKQPEAKQDSSWSEVADFLADRRAEQAKGTSEAIVYGTLRYHPLASARVTAYAYPEAFEGLRDVTLAKSLDTSGKLWETEYPLTSVVGELRDTDVVWLLTSTSRDQRPAVTTTLGGVGFVLDDEWDFEGVRVLRYVR
ncbi:hypothetical protein ACFSBZ_07975 [Amnibacterium flavum]|uniref:Glycosyltransferase RgtA/B/C/D-like domain-containing protein n=1 Tax=Amnibacterium flavum TaxID=2173173 RepID=A0A2V1HTN0_9MICO|nr:hypothetical protein [Amnibacterium flavum]PVZ93454.1 hypothetical protein DDQ50_15950 [Amnibacterium flavum]